MDEFDGSRLRVLDNRHEADGIRRLVLERAAGWTYAAGQVAELATTPGTESFFAIGSSPHERDLMFILKAGGSDSEPLMHLAPGDLVRVRGPYGAGFALPARGHLLFVGGGTALAALRSGLVEALARLAERRASGDRLALVVGVRRPGDLAFTDEIPAWREAGVTVRVIASRPEPGDAWSGPTGWVQAWLDDLVAPDTWAFLAGSDALEDAVEAALVAAGVPRARIQRNYRVDARAAPTPDTHE